MDTDLVHTTDSYAVREGLILMAEAVCHLEYSDAEAWVRSWMNGPDVLLLIEVMKRAEDLPKWFPHGKWATIQAFEHEVSKAIDKFCSTSLEIGGK